MNYLNLTAFCFWEWIDTFSYIYIRCNRRKVGDRVVVVHNHTNAHIRMRIYNNKQTPLHSVVSVIRLPIGSCEFTINIYACDVSHSQRTLWHSQGHLNCIYARRAHTVFNLCNAHQEYMCASSVRMMLNPFDSNMVMLYTPALRYIYTIRY